MPGYIHTCAACGAHMQVHERYLGRTLRCTSCRTEFVAQLPAGAEPAAPAPLPAAGGTSSGVGRSRRWWLALLAVPVAALVWWLGQEPGDGVGGAIFRPQRAVGEIGSLGTGLPGPVVVAFDRDDVGALVATAEAPEPSVLRLFLDAGHGLEVAAGTQVRVLERAARGREVRVRILEGPWESRIVWVPAAWVR